MSVGSALKKTFSDPEAQGNCCYLIEIDKVGAAGGGGLEVFTSHVHSYEADGENYDSIPRDSFYLESPKHVARKFFEFQRHRFNYQYDTVSSIAIINSDGDSHRIVECRGLTVDAANQVPERASSHQVSLPVTSGYLDSFRAKIISDEWAGRSHEDLRTVESVEQTGVSRQKRHTLQYKINFGRVLNPAESFSYQYEWWAVNATALDAREGVEKYGDQIAWDGFEYTHFPVNDPIDALTIIVQFPPGDDRFPREFHARVAPLSDLRKEDDNLKKRLLQKKALQSL